MDIIIGLIVAFAVLASIIFLAKRFLKPVTGSLPDCCSGNGNKDLNMGRKV